MKKKSKLSRNSLTFWSHFRHLLSFIAFLFLLHPTITTTTGTTLTTSERKKEEIYFIEKKDLLIYNDSRSYIYPYHRNRYLDYDRSWNHMNERLQPSRKSYLAICAVTKDEVSQTMKESA